MSAYHNVANLSWAPLGRKFIPASSRIDMLLVQGLRIEVGAVCPITILLHRSDIYARYRDKSSIRIA